MKKFFIAGALILVVISITYKISLIPEAREDSCIFRGKDAVYYEYSKIISQNGKIPSMDNHLNYPEGFNIKNNLPVFMETIIGYSHHFLPGNIKFHRYLFVFLSLYFSLSLLAIFLITKLLTGDIISSLLSIPVLTSILLFYRGIITPQINHIHFATPLLLFSIYFYLRSRESFLPYAVLSGTFLFISIAISRYIALFIPVLSIYVLLTETRNRRSVSSFQILTLFILASCLIIPYLRNSYFFLSVPVSLAVAVSLFQLIKEKNFKYAIVSSILLFLLLTFINIFSSAGESIVNEVLSHFFRSSIFKIQSLFNGGGNWEVKYLSGFFKSPRFLELLLNSGIILPVGILSAACGLYRIKRKESTPIERQLLALNLLVLPLFLLKADYNLLSVSLFIPLIIFELRNIKKLLFLAVVILILTNTVVLSTRRESSPEYRKNYALQAVKFLRNSTEPGSPVLCPVRNSAIFSTFGNRPVILNPLESDSENLKKIKEYEHKIFLSEKEFYDFCSRNKVRYFVYRTDILLNSGRHSMRWRTDNRYLSKASPAFLFHFKPQNLKQFILIFSNPEYRIFEVRYSDIQTLRPRFEYYRIYDIENFQEEKLGIR